MSYNELEEEVNNDEKLPAEQESSKQMSSTENALQKKIQERLSKSVTKNAAKQSLLHVLMPIITWAAVIIICIIILIGIIMFFITMPGMAMEQLKAYGKKVADAFSAFFGGDKTTQVGDEEIYGVLTYLEQMSYDLKGYGFLTDYLDSSNYLDDVAESKKEDAHLDEKIGVTRDSNDEIINAESDFIFTYLVSDNYVYTIANYNQTSEDGTEDYTGLMGALRRIAVGAQAVWRKIENIVVNDGYKWGNGLIHIYYEDGNNVGSLGEYLGSSVKDGVFNWVGAKINTDEDPPTLEIRRGWGANTMKYSLEGWTGRYGMPLEFLLSIHMATYMPDLAYDMVKSFDTQIEILFRNIEGTVVGAYKVGNNYISYDDIYEIAGSFISATEAKKIMNKYHIPSPDGCLYYEELAKQDVDKSDGEEETSMPGVDLDIRYEMSQTIDDYSAMIESMKSYGYTGGSLPESVDSNSLDSLMKDVSEDIEDISDDDNLDYYVCEINSLWYYLGKYEINKKGSISQSWLNEEDGCQYTINISLMHKKFYGVDDIMQYYNVFEIQYPDTYESFSEYCKQNGNLMEVSKVSYNITKSASKEQLEKAGVSSEAELMCSNSDNKKCCSVCTDYLKKIYKYVKKADVEKYKTYQPYIADVKNHWYRDVYFVKGSEDFVQYDYEYESLVKERWTLYETYTNDPDDGYKYNEDKAGETILFVIDENGDFKKDSNGDYVLYDGTMEDANPSVLYVKDGEDYKEYKASKDDKDVVLYRKDSNGKYIKYDGRLSVAKKPVLIDSDDEDVLEDLNWVKNDGLWSAYEISEGATIVDYTQAYSTIDDDETDDDAEMQKNVYAQVTTYNNVVQKGDGQRTETNPVIKRMFLENRYLRYDSGNHSRAEIITALRKAIDDGRDGNYYGVLKGINANGEKVDYTDTTVEIDGKTYKAEDYSGKVNIDQDALNAFSMLENEHTLDADYIYRDFKELIVELGYFEKEELTDETPRLLQWIIPDAGSYGYPFRSIDKTHDKSGTLIHSKGDLDVAKEHTLSSMLEELEELDGPLNPIEPDEQPPDFDNQDLSKIIGDDSLDIIGQVASLNTIPTTTLQTVGSIVDVPAADYTYDPTGSSSQATKIADLEFNGVNYECWWQTSVTCTLYSFAFVASAYTETPYSDYIKETAPYWVPGLSAACFKTAGVEGVYYGWDQAVPAGVDQQAEIISQALSEGKPIYFYSGFRSSYGIHAIVLLGASDSGKVLYFNPWGGVIEEYGTASSFSANLTSLLTTGVCEKGGHLYSFFIPAEPPDGVKTKKTVDEYEGFLGNEAVVSPVTGILIDYGTYNGQKVNDKEEYRTNIDLKYGTQILNVSLDDDGNLVSKEPEATGEIQVDHVGYATILVLDKENYEKFAEAVKEKTRWKNRTFLSSKGEYTELKNIEEDTIKDSWSDLDKTLYGYKEFAELYEEYGIAGNLIHIDGFKCEYPDEEFDNEKDLEDKIPQGEEITLESFETVKLNTFDGEGNISDDKVLESLYEKPEKYKLPSNTATEKLNSEELVKDEAVSSLYLEKAGLRIIKEGTVLGRTMTDKELIESEDRNKKYEDYRKTSESPEDFEEKIIGNYLRIVMTDTVKSNVENVEDYMKLDDGQPKNQKLDDEKFLYWMGIYAEGGTLKQDGSKYISIADDLGDGAGPTHYFGLTHYNIDLAHELGYNHLTNDNWGDNIDLETLTNIYLALIETDNANIKKELGEDIPDGYRQAFISISHNYGNLTKRGREYKEKGSVSESTWTTYEDPSDQYAEALTRRRVAEWALITEGKYMNYNDGNTGEIDFTAGGKYSEETPFSDWCKDYGVTDIKVEKSD